MHSWKKKLVVSQLALACTLAITSQANATTNDISGTTYNTFHLWGGDQFWTEPVRPLRASNP
ncbi:hypothetical protein FPN25_16460 [Salmonella enterica]|nr:hypothetical protein [Salmonella enterica]